MRKETQLKDSLNIAIAECLLYPRYWEDSEINGKSDNPENPRMPCVCKAARSGNRQRLAWAPMIDLDKGRILNWSEGVTASIHYKSVDENYIDLWDHEGDRVLEYEGYVPKFLCPKSEGHGDYIIMDIDKHGYIQNFRPELNDMFHNNLNGDD